MCNILIEIVRKIVVLLNKPHKFNRNKENKESFECLEYPINKVQIHK